MFIMALNNVGVIYAMRGKLNDSVQGFVSAAVIRLEGLDNY